MSTQDLANYMEKGYWNDASDSLTRVAKPHHWSTKKSEITYDFDGSVNQQTQELVHQAFERWGEIIDMKFEHVRGVADITIETGNGDVTDSHYPGNNVLVASSNPHLMNSATITLNSISSTDTTQNYTTVIHEIGHAIGLGHAGPYNAGGGNLPDGGNFSDAHKFDDDSDKKTVMSYFEQNENPNVSDRAQASPITPQIADVVAAKSIYGLDPDTRDGDTVYGYDDYNNSGFPIGFSSSELINATPAEDLDPDSDHSPFNPDEWNGNNASFTIYDAGGTDIIDMSSASSDQIIDLNPGQFSSVGGVSDVSNNSAKQHPGDDLDDPSDDPPVKVAIVNNMTIAPGVTIEDAVGGSGDDILVGNEANNTLGGNKGEDRLRGKEGNDTFVYRPGGDVDTTDTVNGGSGQDRLYFAPAGDYDIRDLDADSIEKIRTKGDVQVELKSSQVMEEESTLDNITWNHLHDSAGSFNTTVKMTGDKLDLSDWSFDNYTQRKNEDFDNLKQVIKVEGQDSDQSIQTTNLSDRIVTGKGANDVSAGAGDDLVITSGSETLNDALDGGDGEDTIDFSSEDFSNATIDLSDDNGMTYPNWLETEPHSIFGNNNNPRYQPLNNFENVKGSAGANTILGNDGPNQLNGNAGADVLQPGGGSDELTGSDGADEFFFEPKTGPDNTITDFESGADVLNLSAFDFTDFGEVKNIATEIGDGLELKLNTRQETHEIFKQDPFPHVETVTELEKDKVTLQGMTESDLDPSDVYLTADDPTDQDPFNTTPIGTIGTDFSDISI